MAKEYRKKQYEVRHEPVGKITVTIDGELGEHRVMKDQDYVLVVGGKAAVHNDHEGTDMNVGLMGEISLEDMVDIVRCVCKSHPAMQMAMQLVLLQDMIQTKQVIDREEDDEEDEKEDTPEQSLDDLLDEIFGNKEQ